MRNTLIGAAIIVGLLLIVAVVAPFLIPSSVYKSQIESGASAALGRDVSVDGDVSVRIFPRIQARANTVTIANPPGFSDRPFAAVEELRAGLAILPLLSRRVDVSEFVLVRPTISLEVRRDGANNWTLTPASSEADPAPAPSGPFRRAPGQAISGASLGDVRLVDASATFTDAASGARHDIADLDAVISLAAIDKPLSARADFVLDAVATSASVQLKNPKGFLEGAETPFSASVSNALVELTIDGVFDESPDLAFTGRVKLASPDMRALAAATGADLPPGEAWNTFSASGLAVASPSAVRFEDAKVALDDISGTGRFGINLAAARPKITGNLTLGDVDVTPYMPPSTTQAGAKEARETGWSTDPIDLTALKLADADLALVVNSLTVDALSFDRSAIAVDLTNGRLEAKLTELNAYGGAGKATAVVNARAGAPSFSLNAELDGLQAQPLLRDAAQFSRLTGVGRTFLDVSASGTSQAEIMRSLSGTGDFQFADGALTGVNLGAAARGIEQALKGELSREVFATNASTDFSELIGAFTIANGIATLQDFDVKSPFLRVAGSGALNLAEQSLAVSLAPSLVGDAVGQGGQALSGVTLPIKIEGAWNAVKIGVDQAALNAAAQAALRARAGDEVGRALDRSLDGPASDLVRGALGLPGRPAEPAPETPGDEDAPAPGDAEGAETELDAAVEEEPKSAEDELKDRAEDELRNALGGLFGSGDE